MADLVTFGETMLRLSPPRGQRLSRVAELDVHVGGAESNVAVAAANLGVDAAWLSALPDSDLGDRVTHALRGEGVDPVVARTETGRVGTYYFERGAQPRDPAVVYDRAGTPIREATTEDLSVERVRDAAVFFTSGITPALSETAATTTADLLATARDAGATTAFDLNYRGKLWEPAAARETLTDRFPDVDVLFVAERDARRVLECDGSAADVARTLRDSHGFGTVVVTQGAEGALAAGDDGVHEQPAFGTETVDPVGSGDALVGGYLAAHLDGGSVPDALATGVAAAALSRTVEGDAATISRAEVDAVLAGRGDTDDSIDR